MLLNKKGKPTDGEIESLVMDLHNHRLEEDLNQETVDREMRPMELTLAKYNVEQLGVTPIEREDGAMRILVCQMGGLASPEVREIKIAATESLIKKYDIHVCVMMENNFNWSKVNSLANLASWFQEEREVRSVTAHNTTEQHVLFSKKKKQEVQVY
jgi:beta-xylosidase